MKSARGDLGAFVTAGRPVITDRLQGRAASVCVCVGRGAEGRGEEGHMWEGEGRGLEESGSGGCI